MISRLAGSKLMPWLSGGLAVLAITLLAAVYVLHARNGLLNVRLGNAARENAQLSESLRQQSADYQSLSQELVRRDALVSQARDARQNAERGAREQISILRKALANDDCANRLHPDAITDSLRLRATDSVQD